jgi:CRP-like cAMP-binding protein
MKRQEGRWPANSSLGAFSASTSAEIVQLGTFRKFEARRVLLHESEQSTHVVLLLSGLTKVTAVTPDGGFALLAIRGPGDFVGELASLDGQPRSATVTTASTVEARVLSQAQFQGFLSRHPDTAVAIIRGVGRKLRLATQRRVNFSGTEVQVRLARVLLELVSEFGRPSDDGVEIEVPLTQPELAALVGAAEPTVHKVLAALRRERVLTTGYRSLTVHDLVVLRTIAGLPQNA